MKKFFSSRLWLVIIALAMVAAAPFPYKKMKVFMLHPPELVLDGVRQIAVVDFGGASGATFTDQLVTLMLMEDRGIGAFSGGFFKGAQEGRTLQEGAVTNIYEIIERSQLNSILREQNFSNSGLVEQGQAAEIGRIAGVQAIVIGEVKYTHDTQDRTVEVTSRGVTRRVPVRKRRVDTSYQLKVIDVETGQILGSVNQSTYVEDEKWEDDRKNIFDVQTGVAACMETLARHAADYLTPHFLLAEFELEKIKAKEFKDTAEEAAKLAEELDVDGAYLLYKKIYEKDSYNPKLLHNMALLNEVVGNFGVAQEFMAMAQQLDSKEKKYREALDRIEKRIVASEALAAVGVALQEHSFEFSAEEEAAALAETIELRGKDSERIEIFKSPAMQQVVARVPGGATFTLLGEDEDCYKIKLLGDNEGFVRRSDVK